MEDRIKAGSEECSNCKFFWQGVSVCRRYPPKFAVFTMWDDEGKRDYLGSGEKWPDVHLDGWCGEFEWKPHPQ